MNITELRYYESDSYLPFHEDHFHEFKGHTNISEEEVPEWTKIKGSERRTRAPISRCVNAFLNTGMGGTVYLGINNEGKIHGVPLTLYRQDHVEESLWKTLARYKPPVDRHRVDVHFVPVVPKNASPDMIDKVLKFNPETMSSEGRRTRLHNTLDQTCWCMKDSSAKSAMGFIVPSYVIEIQVHAWNPDDERNSRSVGRLKLHPLHEDEVGTMYFRHEASCKVYSPEEVHILAQELVRRHYAPKQTPIAT